MVDIHCHILPGLDDGAPTLETAVQMAEIAIADGVTHIVGTPHANARYQFDPDLIRRRRDELQAAVGERLLLATGCDFHLSFENLEQIQAEPDRFTINQKRYLLVEFAEFSIPPQMDDTLHHLQLLGLLPIITHPERNRLIRSHPERLRGWLHQGCYVQVTAQALLGQFGDSARKYVEEWLDEEMIHFVASDAHDTEHRPPLLAKAYKTVASRCGLPRAEALFRDNPLAAFEGRPLPYEPEQTEAALRAKPRKRFLFF